VSSDGIAVPADDAIKFIRRRVSVAIAHEAGIAHASDPSGAEAFLQQAMADFTLGMRGVMEGLQS